jgi:hypothetical protein
MKRQVMTKLILLPLLLLPTFVWADPVVEMRGSLDQAQEWTIIVGALIVIAAFGIFTMVKSEKKPKWAGKMEQDIAGLKTDVAGLKTDVAGLKTDVAMLKTDVAILKTDVGDLKLDTLRLQILCPELPATDRLRLYDEYKRLGGNSYIDAYIENIKKDVAEDIARKEAEARRGNNR